RILRREGEKLGYRPHFTISDTSEQIALACRAMRSVHGVGKVKPDELFWEISNLKSQGVTPRQFARTAIEEREMAVASVYRKYQEAMKTMGMMDFDDLLLNAVALLRDHDDARDHWQERARYLLVDEFQDTNDVQMDLVKFLAEKHRNLCVVGDDDQSIYAWRGARPQNIIHFDRTYPDAKVVRLEENYRSTNTILEAANHLIGHNEDRVGKTLFSGLGRGDAIDVIEAEDLQVEAETIVARIRKSLKDGLTQPQDHAILLRTNGQSRNFEEELMAENLPYIILGGTSFFDRKEVRDVLGFLGVAANSADDGSLLRIINIPSRGFGTKSVEALSRYAQRQHLALSRALEHAEEIEGLPPPARKGAKRLVQTLERCRAWAEKRDPSLVDRLLEALDYQQEIEHLYEDPLEQASRMNIAREVGTSLNEFLERNPHMGLSDFLSATTLGEVDNNNEKDKEIERKAIRLITLHSAKGLEFPHVYMVGMQEGMLPHQNSVDTGDISEERRLAYVGITRAQEKLSLSYASQRVFRGRPIKLKPSRFLDELPKELLVETGRAVAPSKNLDYIQSIRSTLGE
ncbi:MAG: ATP-dependent helicase, partial [Planctomycetota bacterium]